eukprot:PhF_6_TR39655/c1_g1_i1/m.58840
MDVLSYHRRNSNRQAPQAPTFSTNTANGPPLTRRQPTVPSIPIPSSHHAQQYQQQQQQQASRVPARSLSAKTVRSSSNGPAQPETHRPSLRSIPNGNIESGDHHHTHTNNNHYKVPEPPEVTAPGNGIAVSAAQCLRHFSKYLTDFEQGEVLQYPVVYCLGCPVHEKVRGSIGQPKNNNGYDDDRGDYQYVLGDHLGYRFETLTLLGKGSFGQVFAAIDHKLQR